MRSAKLLAVLSFIVFMLSATVLAEELPVQVVKQTTVQRFYHLDGVVEAVNRSTLTAQTSGQVRALYFDVDDYVEAGQVILQMDDTEQQAGVKQAQANLKAAKAGLEDASDEFKRVKEIFAKKLVAKSELDKAQAMLKKAKANREAALASLEQAQKQLDYTKVTAPYSGLVTERHIEVGETAQPGAPLLSGISLDKLRVVVDVPQNLIAAIRKFKQARVQNPESGWIDVDDMTVFPFAEKNSNTFKVRLELPEDSEGLLPGMFVKVAFVSGDEKVLLVAPRAVVYRSEVTGIYVVNDNDEVMFRHIRVGHAIDPDNLIVLSGLLENEKVILDPIAAGVLLKRQRQHKDDHE